MLRVLITGASGFLGNAIAEQAIKKENWEVYGLISGRRQVNLPYGVRPVVGNLFDYGAIERLIDEVKPDILLHLAWNLEKKDFLRSPANLRCLEMSLTLLRCFVESGGKRCIFSGSSAEYGYEKSVCLESDVANPSDLYGQCKLSFTQLAEFFCQQNNIEYATARYFSIYGAGEKSLVHAIPFSINAFMNGDKFICRNPQNVWDYVYIDDVAEATVRVMESNFTGIVNVGTGHAVTMREVFETIADELGVRHLLECEEKTDEAKMSIADTRVLNEIIGYTCKTELKEGIGKTVRWMKQYYGAIKG